MFPPLAYIAYCEAMHFILAFCVGLLAYCLISTTCRFTSGYWPKADRYTLLFCCSVALASHMLADYWHIGF